MLRNYDTFRSKFLENTETLGFELSCRNGLLFKHKTILNSDQSSDQLNF